MIGFANVLLKNREGNLRQHDTAYLERILDNGKHLLLLINEILDLAKIEAGKVVIERIAVDLRDVVRGVAAQFEGQFRTPDVERRTELPPDLEPVTTDPDRLRQVLLDDAPEARQLLVELLAGHASEVKTAENGQVAVALLRTFKPDLVITDLLMPVMDGMTLLEIFRGTRRFQNVPVIVVTAKDLTPADRHRLDRHTAAVLQKGNALESDLRRLLHAVLSRAGAGEAAAGTAGGAA